MSKKRLITILLFMGGTLFLLPGFSRDKWKVVEPSYYNEWQTRYDRLVVARLVKTRQDGAFSSGGLLGLGDVDQWNFLNKTNKHQFNAYLNNKPFNAYLAYQSNPGFQGLIYGTLDGVLNISGEQKLKLFRYGTALVSAMVFAIIFTMGVLEFGFLSGLLMILFIAFSQWIILPAGSIFWSFWTYYLPLLASIHLLIGSSKNERFNSKKIYGTIFVITLIKILVSGFDLLTPVLVMTSVPFVYFSIYHKWDQKLFISRIIKLGIALFSATLTGVLILLTQIVASTGNLENAFDHIFYKIGSYTVVNMETSQNLDATDPNVFGIIKTCLTYQALTIRYRGQVLNVLFWHLIIIFSIFTLSYVLVNIIKNGKINLERKAVALIVSTWYSILAPLSWYIIFYKNSFYNPHIVVMAWQMPFTLLGFALCGFVVTNSVKKEAEQTF